MDSAVRNLFSWTFVHNKILSGTEPSDLQEQRCLVRPRLNTATEYFIVLSNGAESPQSGI